MAFSEEYYIRVQGDQKGPYSFPQLKKLYDNEFLPEDTLYWKDGMEQWQIITDLCGAPPKERRRKIRVKRSLVVAGLIAVAAVAAYLLPMIKEGWREAIARGYSPGAAYWRARGFVREDLRKNKADVAFDRFDPAAVILSSGTGATVTLSGTVFPESGPATRTTWHVTMRFNRLSQRWLLPMPTPVPPLPSTAPKMNATK
jgi:hypothetical protein